MYSLGGAQLHLTHQVLGHLFFDLNLVLQRRLAESPIDENLERLPEVEVIFVEARVFLGLFLSLDLHGGGRGVESKHGPAPVNTCVLLC